MSIPNKKISLRGSLAGDIAKQLHPTDHEATPPNIIGCILRMNPDDLLCISEGDLLKIGKISDLGKYAPDW